MTAAIHDGLRNRVYIVTGGTRGIGLAITRAIVQRGGRVVSVARVTPPSAGQEDNGSEEAGSVLFLQGNVADPGWAPSTIERTLEHFGHVGAYLIDARKCERDCEGAIVNIASDAGRRGTIGQAHYAASKAGLHALTMSAAREWGKYGVRVNTVSFGVVETAMTEPMRSERFAETYRKQIPLGRWSTPDEVAPTVCHLLSSESRYLTGEHIAVNGGLHINY